jgi:hypothetical protein
MHATNYTDIDHLVKKHKQPSVVARHPEAEPILSPKEPLELHEVKEADIPSEVQPYVEAKPENVELPQELKQAGLQPVESTQFPTYQNIKLPISDDKVLQGLHQPITSSWRWLAAFSLYLLGQAHLGLKRVHGRVVRIVKR